jgi:hypothetical protein
MKKNKFASPQNILDANKRIEGDCWLWTGRRDVGGYGVMVLHRKDIKVHRVSYCINAGISLIDLKDYVLHRTNCPNKNCFNPEHLYAGNHQQNAMDAITTGKNANTQKTHCVRGHEYNEENTYMYNGSRHCKLCHNLRQRQKYQEKFKPLGISDIESQVLGTLPRARHESSSFIKTLNQMLRDKRKEDSSNEGKS